MSHLRPLVVLLGLVAMLAAACGGDGDVGGAATAGPQPTRPNSSEAPVLTAPASRFALALPDLPAGYLTDRAGTFVLDAANYGQTGIFTSPEEGTALLEQWGYLGGFETAFEPEQRMTAVLNGAYYAAVEVHLFRDEAGAGQALAYFEERLSSASEPVNADGLGNESSAWKITRDTIPGSNIAAAYHRVVFRRGNLVAVVQTYGSDVLMAVSTATSLARIVDQKALGEIPAVEPTPVNGTATSSTGQ